MAKKEPDESERMQVTSFGFNLLLPSLIFIVCSESAYPLLVNQMTDARCSRCSEFKVGVRDIIQAGHGERYQVHVFSFLFLNPLKTNLHPSNISFVARIIVIWTKRDRVNQPKSAHLGRSYKFGFSLRGKYTEC